MGSCSALHSKMMLLRSTEKYCDVKIRVQDMSFSCHRVVLASGSEYFDALFGGSFMEKDAYETVLHDIDVETFKEILTCVYTPEMCTITASNVFNLLSASLFLVIHSLEEACTKYILENVSSIQNHIRILVLARSLNITALIDVVTEHVIQNFQSFYNDEILLEMAYDDLSFLLDRWSTSKLPFKYEDLLLHFLIRWVQCASKERKEYFVKLIAGVDFERISPNYITFMMQCYKDFTEYQGLEVMPSLNLPPVVEESKSTSGLLVENWHEDSKKRLCFKRKFSEFLTERKLLATCSQEIPVPFHDPTFYKDVLGLHLYVEYIGIDCQALSGSHKSVERSSEGVRVLSANKYYPDWFVSCETDAWKSCAERCTIVQQSTSLLYCMEIFQDRDNRHRWQKFCTYSSTDLKLSSRTALTPPVPLYGNSFNMCATSKNDIYLFDFHGIRSYFKSLKENNKGFYRYDSEVDKWFPAPEMKSFQKYPSICADHNLIYSIGGVTRSCTFQAFDHRSGKWMTLPMCIAPEHQHGLSNSCVLQDKVFISSGPVYTHSYDTIAGKWESICPPTQYGKNPYSKLVSYDNKLCLLYTFFHDFQSHYALATYSPSTQEWYLYEGLDHVISKCKPNKTEGKFKYEWRIKDMITFKTCSS